MPALLVNVRIDSAEKFDLFRVTLSDIGVLFAESHVKVRGRYAAQCIEYVRTQLKGHVYFHQELQERDWVVATIEILRQVQSRSVLLYFEDHRLIADRQYFERILADFDAFNLDYLCYSFFKASQLDAKNLLPLGVVSRVSFKEFVLRKKTVDLLGKISPSYYTYSLMSLVSVAYLGAILSAEHAKHKIFIRKLIAILTALVPYPAYRRVLKGVNRVLAHFGVRLCVYPPASPFNLEKMWFESVMSDVGWKFAVPNEELFANYDDDNGVYQESLMKRGLYPFSPHVTDTTELAWVEREATLSEGESLDCTYYSHNGRISRPPLVDVEVVRGAIVVAYQGHSYSLADGERKRFYSNLGPVIRCVSSSRLVLRIHDEVFLR